MATSDIERPTSAYVAAVGMAACRLQAAQNALDDVQRIKVTMRQSRDRHIRDALERGADVAALARVSGLSPERIGQIRRER